MSMIDKSEVQRKHFNSIAEKYNQARSGEKHLAYKDEWWNYLFKRLDLLSLKGKKAKGLESMCGTADISKLFIKKYPELAFDAFDYSDSMVEEGSKRVEEYNINIFQADALKYKKEEFYDVVVLIGGLHHVPDSVPLVLENIFKSLKKGGLFVNLEPTQNNFLFKKVREHIYKKNDLFEDSSERGFDLDELNSLYTSSGLKVVDQYYPGLLGYVLYYNPDAFPILNRGFTFFAKTLAKVDLLFGRTLVGKYFSFATWTICSKE